MLLLNQNPNKIKQKTTTLACKVKGKVCGKIHDVLRSSAVYHVFKLDFRC